jgi:hypothetical protein
MKGRIHLGNAWWELEPESLSGLREVAADPWEVALMNALAAWWDDTDAMELMMRFVAEAMILMSLFFMARGRRQSGLREHS